MLTLVVIGGAGALAVLILAVSEVRAARTDLLEARSILRSAVDQPAALSTKEGRHAARSGMASALEALDRTRRRLSGVRVLALARSVPILKSQPSALLTLVDDATTATTAARRLIDQADALADRTQLRSGLIPLDGLRDLQREVRDASAHVGQLARRTPYLIPPLASARREFDELARSTATRLADASEAMGAARSFLGAAGDRRYLMPLLNNAEMRNQGMVLSYATLRVNSGVVSFDRSASVIDLRLDRPTATPIPEGTQEVFGSILPTQFWQSVNATADFAWSGRAMVDMYEQATGVRVDGVVAIDVPGLAALLRAVGPVSVPGINESVTDENVARIVLHDAYTGLAVGSDQTLRKEQQGEVTQAVVERLTTGVRDAVALGQHLGSAAAGGHLRLWSADTAEEQVFERTGLGGGPATTLADRTFHVAVENRTATKLDYYVKPRVRQEVRLTKSGDAYVRTSVTVENHVPPGSAPSVALGPDQNMAQPGEYRAWMLLWSPAGSEQPGGIPESGLLLSQHIILVNPGETKELTFLETVIPNAVREGRLQLRLVPQSRLEPVPLEVRLETDGWDVEGSRSWSGPWDRVQTLTWRVHR